MRLPSLYILVALLTFALGVAASYLSVRLAPEIEVKEIVAVSTHVENTHIEPVLPAPATFGRSDRLASIEIRRHDPDIDITERTLDPRNARSDFELELGESIENQIIVLRPWPGDAHELKIEQQFETSMAIGDEGPHIDFTDWKHFTSGWSNLKTLGGNRFLTLKIPHPERFPQVTRKEIYQVAKELGGRRWARLASECKGPNAGPCYVGVNRITFRISAQERGRWRVIHRLNFSIPVGC